VYSNVVTYIGPVLPRLSEEFNLAPDFAGIIVGLYSVGGLISVLGGWISDKTSRILIAAISLFMMAAASLFLGLAPNIFVVGLSLMLMGVAAGFLESSVNAFVSDLYSEKRGLSVNLFHIGFNVGSTIGPLLAVFLIVATGSWRAVYFVPPLVLILFSFLMVILNKNIAKANKVNKWKTTSLITKRNLSVYLPMGSIGFFYIATEMGVSTWLASILESSGSAVFEAGLTTSLFWGLMGIGRLIWGSIVDKTGYEKCIIVSSGLSLVCIIFASLSLPLSFKMMSWSMLGFFLAPIFPTLIAWVTSTNPELGGSSSGLVFTIGRLGLLFSNCLAGIVSEVFGVESSQFIFVAFTAAMLIDVLIMYSVKRRKTMSHRNISNS
jgi:MFS family permease